MAYSRRAGAGLALLFLLGAACGSGDKPTQVATAPTTTVSTTLPPTTLAPKSKVVLDGAGAQPRSVLRLHLAAGATGRTAMVTKIGLSVSVDGKATPPGVLPAIRTVLEQHVDRVDADGAAHLSMSVAEIATVPTAGADPTVVKGTDTALQVLKGLKGTSTVDPQGHVSNVTFDTRATTDPSIQNTLDSLVSQVGSLAAPFPAEAVGIGARWTVASTTSLTGLQLATTTQYTLRSHSGDAYQLDVVLDATAVPGAASLPNLPAGAQLSVGNFTLHNTGQLTGDLSRFLPTKSSTSGAGDGSFSMTIGTKQSTLTEHLTVDVTMSDA